MWTLLEDETYSNSLCIEGDMKGVTQDILSRNHQNFDVH